MTQPNASQKSQPSPWAVGLLLASSLFAAISIVLVSTGYSPV